MTAKVSKIAAKLSKIAAKAKSQYEVRMQGKWEAFSQHIAREQAGGNTRLANVFELFPDAKSYGWDFIDKFKMVALVPAKTRDHSYYALRGHGVAFLADYTGVDLDKQFIFDSEHTYLRGADTKPKEAYHAHITDNPVVLFFFGGDDGHVGMRFASKAHTLTFIDMLDSFEDVFDFDKNPKAVHKGIMSAETIEEQKEQLDMTLCYHN